MKKTTNLLLAVLMIFAFSESCNAQLWKKLKQKAEDAIVKSAEKEIDKTVNGDDSPSSNEDEDNNESVENNDENTNNTVKKQNSLDTPELWRDYRYVPGEDVIFYDDLKSEQVGEFPSRWDLVEGAAEVAKINGEKAIILLAKNQNTITPLFNSKDYLGDEFTIEYDILIPDFDDLQIWYTKHDLFFNTTLRNEDVEMEITAKHNINGHVSNSHFKIETTSVGTQNAWHHIAISYYKGKFKLYYDSKRISNIPNLGLDPTVFGIGLLCHSHAENQPYLAVKNFRIAHGGGEMYNRIVADGKYVTNGIVFDSGKSVIKDTSLGIINQMVSILQDNADWKFDIIGYTDSDGTNANNLILSKDRANAVKDAIVDQGIKADRLNVIGKGESDPLNTNSTPEEKANNRRVAFVKK
ncbi:OmpA family protein [Formosa sp. L2A11]|uniref:OmpA family protein n=1 Tax=Formosa sp. L2A11 TaxID=2686363 RepID=UPI001E51B2E4|nr:OmpA family protein [Formosa sp. L2A11]